MDALWDICPYTDRFSSRVHAFPRMALFWRSADIPDQTCRHNRDKPFIDFCDRTPVPPENALQNEYGVKILINFFSMAKKKFCIVALIKITYCVFFSSLIYACV